MKLLVLVLLQFVITFAIGQKTERFDGEFYNGISIKGTANYTYYTDSNNKNIKHGSFRYSAREKTDSWRYSHSISGSYDNGLKDGIWTYNLVSKDFDKDQYGYFFDVEVQLTAAYSKGNPQGKWQYHCLISKHKRIAKQGKFRNTDESITENINIALNWKNGVLIDSLIINDLLKQTISISMDDRGFLNGAYSIETKSKIDTKNYEAGILASTIKGGIEETDVEYAAYKKLKSPESQVKKKKNSVLSQKPNDIETYLNKYIYNEVYFMSRYIDGDLLLITDKKFGDFIVKYKGLYYFELSPILNSKELEIDNDIKVKYEKIKQAEWQVNQNIRKNPKVQRYIDDKLRITTALKEYDRFECQMSYYKKYVSLEKLLKDGQYKCFNMPDADKFKTKIDYLNSLNEMSIKQYSILTAYQQL